MTPHRTSRHAPRPTVPAAPAGEPAGRGPARDGATEVPAAGAPSRRVLLLLALAALGAPLLPPPALARDGEEDGGRGRGRGRGRGGDGDSDRGGRDGDDGGGSGHDRDGSGGSGSGARSGRGGDPADGSGPGSGGGSGGGSGTAQRVRDVTVLYPDGWVERITGGSYELIDDQSRLVVRRAATPADASRMMALR